MYVNFDDQNCFLSKMRFLELDVASVYGSEFLIGRFKQLMGRDLDSKDSHIIHQERVVIAHQRSVSAGNCAYVM